MKAARGMSIDFANDTGNEEHLKGLVARSWQGMRQGHPPMLCKEGVGGTYFMRDEQNKTIGVFKPQDEEMGCLNNPKGFTPGSLNYNKTKRGVQEGEAAYRECAAYVLDHEHFAGVPATDLVVCNHPSFNNSPVETTPAEECVKIGSFQEFKEHDFDAEDISPSRASKFPVNEVHKIAILDIRLFNTDRHGGNILIRKINKSPVGRYRRTHLADSDGEEEKPHRNYDSEADENGMVDSDMQFQMEMGSDPGSDYDQEVVRYIKDDDDGGEYELIPIDHGYTLPHTISGLQDSWFEWLNWPQARKPFGPEAKAYIARLDAEKDIALLKQKFGNYIRPECYKVLRITTLWLKTGAEMGLTPLDIGQMMCMEPSQLEKMCWEAEELAEKQRDGENMNDLFFENLAVVMKRVAGERKKEKSNWYGVNV